MKKIIIILLGTLLYSQTKIDTSSIKPAINLLKGLNIPGIIPERISSDHLFLREQMSFPSLFPKIPKKTLFRQKMAKK